MSRATIIHADGRQAMQEMAPESIDAIVCDPPYGLEFMGKGWDKLSGTPGYAGPPMQQWHEAWAIEALRVLKPGRATCASAAEKAI